MAKKLNTRKTKAPLKGNSPSELSARGEENAKRFLDMETDVYDVGNMASSTALILDGFISEYRGISEMSMSAQDLVQHLSHWENALDFMVHALKGKANALRTYYEAIP